MHDREIRPGVRVDYDLGLIRNARNVDIRDIHSETKVPVDTLEHFEEGGIIDSGQFSRVYLRAFVRSYAVCVGIDPDLALEALTEHLNGRYRGKLAIEYLGLDPGSVPAPPKEEEGAPEKTEQAEKKREAAHRAAVIKRRSVSRASRNRRAPKWIGVLVVLAIVLAAAVGAMYVAGYGPFDPGNDQAGSRVPEATSAFAEEPVAPVVVPQLGDSISLVIIAAVDRLDPIRVRTDAQSEQPHWIERGDSLRVSAAERFAIRGPIGRAQFLVEGQPWTRTRLNQDGEVIIQRAAVQTFLDSLFQHHARPDADTVLLGSAPQLEVSSVESN